MPAGYCTRVPKSGTAKVRHSWSPKAETACSQVMQQSGTAAMAAETRNLNTFGMSARPSFSFCGANAVSSPSVPETSQTPKKAGGTRKRKKQTVRGLDTLATEHVGS